jgi:hypothetical protein
MKDQVDFLVKVRDAAALVLDACNEYLESLEPPGMEKRTWPWDPSKIRWVHAEGAKGPFERSDDVGSLDYKELLKDLSAHGGKLNRGGWFYWSFSDNKAVGRKQR